MRRIGNRQTDPTAGENSPTCSCLTGTAYTVNGQCFCDNTQNQTSTTMPTIPLPDGFRWVWNATAHRWIPQRISAAVVVVQQPTTFVDSFTNWIRENKTTALVVGGVALYFITKGKD